MTIGAREPPLLRSKPSPSTGLVDDVFVVLDAYKIDRCILAAESAGALTALGAALRRPERIEGLVLVDGQYYRGVPPEQDAFLKGLQADYPATLDWFVVACVPEPDSEHLRRWGRQILRRASQGGRHRPAARLRLSRSTPRARPGHPTYVDLAWRSG